MTRFWNNLHQIRSVKRLENHIISKSLGAINQRPKQERQNQLRLPMSEE
jgi:hypothetical protein